MCDQHKFVTDQQTETLDTDQQDQLEREMRKISFQQDSASHIVFYSNGEFSDITRPYTQQKKCMLPHPDVIFVICVCLSVCQPVCLSVSLSVCLSVSQSVRPSVLK